MQGIQSGYAIVPGCLSDDECDAITGLLSSEAVSRSRAGARHLMANATVSALANDRRLTDIAREWLSATAIAFRATLFEKSNNANWLVAWHQDTALPLLERSDMAGWGPWSEKADV